jgi:hypothetical protein
MAFASEYFRAVRKELLWLCGITATALSIGFVIHTRFELFATIAAVPLSVAFTSAIILPSYLWEWRFVVREEARKRGITFNDFISGPEYREFLKRTAPGIIKRRLRL